MRKLVKADRNLVYNAPIINWDTDTYTPLPNKTIMDLIESKIHDLNLDIVNEEYKVTTADNGAIKGVIGTYNVASDNGEFGQRIMFRNSYDKSMSFAFCEGLTCWICQNGCVSGDYEYKRIHRGVNSNDSSTTEKDVVFNVDAGFKTLQESFVNTLKQMEELKHFDVSPEEAFKMIGELFFKQEVLNISQMSVIKKELEFSNNFKHLGDLDFTAFDLYNHITESLKLSHPLTYIKDHIATHSLFIDTFNI